MKHCTIFVCLLISSASAQTTGPILPETRDAVARIVTSIMLGGHSYDYNRQLADEIGPRLTGSEGYKNSVHWALKEFAAVGLKAHTEPFTMASLWEPNGVATGRMVLPRTQTLHVFSMGWSPSTRTGGVRGRVFYEPELLDVGQLKKNAEKISDSIVLIDEASLKPKKDDDNLEGKVVDSIQTLKSLGATACAWSGSASNDVENSDLVTRDASFSPLPIANIGKEDFELLKRLSEEGPVVAELLFSNRTKGQSEVDNVVAEIPGREFPEQWVGVAAHLDSWHPGTGAQDDGSGVAAVLEAARAIQGLGRAPRRSIRFLLFGGEEQGHIGSQAYVRDHAGELERCLAVLVSDGGAGEAHGWLTFEQSEPKAYLSSIGTLLAGIGGDGTSDSLTHLFESDHTSFFLAGVPVFVLWTDTKKYFAHTPGDTFDKIDQHTLVQGTAIVAATAYALADGNESLAHLSKAVVEQTLKNAHKYQEYLDLKNHHLIPEYR
jgi:carboxypeptidase Q